MDRKDIYRKPKKAQAGYTSDRSFDPEELARELDEFTLGRFSHKEEKEEQPAEMELNEYSLVVQANELIRSKQEDMTLMELKLLKLAISQVAYYDTDFKTYTCKVTELAKLFGVSSQLIYKEVTNTIDRLMRKVITIKDKKLDTMGKYPWRKFHWIETAYYDSGVITLRLSDEIKPYIIGLNELFTSYDYCNVLALNTTYSIRLYELLMSFYNMRLVNDNDGTKKQRQLYFDIAYLRSYFNCEKKYSNTGDFVRRVIAPAVEDINTNSSITATYEIIKEGKQIATIIFKIADNEISGTADTKALLFDEHESGEND